MCLVILYRSSKLLKVGTMLLPPSGMRDTLHNRVVGSLHPQSIISPLYVTLQPVLWKNNSHPASASLDAASRLLDMSGDRCAIQAFAGSLLRSKRRVSVVSKVPFG